jgi:hypothetical protein
VSFGRRIATTMRRVAVTAAGGVLLVLVVELAAWPDNETFLPRSR